MVRDDAEGLGEQRTRVRAGLWAGDHVLGHDFVDARGIGHLLDLVFEANEAKLAASRARAETMGAVRNGPALAAGLVFWGRCHRRMIVRYHARHSHALPEYE